MSTIGRKRKKHPVTTFDAAYVVFSSIYNRPGLTELQPVDQCQQFWNSQTVMPGLRCLMFRTLGAVEWKKTSSQYYNCKSGHTKNYTRAEKIESNRKSKLQRPPEERQRNYVESNGITATIAELDRYSEQNFLPKIEWVYVPDCIRPDILCRFPTTPQGLFIALQFKAASFKPCGQMIFQKTAGYEMPLICVTIDNETVREILLFPNSIQMQHIGIHHGKPSRVPMVQAARRTSISQIYNLISELPLERMKTRDAWVYDERTAATETYRGLEVQRFTEDILGEWVVSPSQQNQAVDGYIYDVAVSFKTASKKNIKTKSPQYGFDLGKSPNIEDVDVFIIGFRDVQDKISSLAVLPRTAVDCRLQTHSWSYTLPFRGTQNITTREQLLGAIEWHLTACPKKSVI